MRRDIEAQSRDRKIRAALVLAALLLSGRGVAAGTPAGGRAADFEVVPSIGHFRAVERIVYSPDGQWLVSSGVRLEGTSRVWRDGRLRHVLRGTLATLAPDGETVLTATEGLPARHGAVRRYRVESGELLWEAESPTVSSLAATADGSWVVAACDDGAARVWDLETGKLLRQVEGRSAWLGELALSSDGSLAATSHRQIVSVWSLAAGEHGCQLQGHSNMISGLAFAADGSYLASSSHDGAVRLWDPRSCRAKAVLQGDSGRLDHLALSPDGKMVVAAGAKALWMWDVETEQPLGPYTVEGEWISALTFDPRGEWVAVGHVHGRISLLKPGNARPFRTLHSRFGLSWIEPSPTGDELATGHFGIDLIPLTTTAGNRRLYNFKRHIDGVMISEDRSQVVTQSDKTIRIWDLETGRPPIALDGSRALSSTDGAVVVVGEHERSDGIRIWHRDTRLIVDEVRHDATITAFDLDRGGKLLATGAADGTVRLWNVNTGEQLRQLLGPSSAISGVVFVEDARAVASTYSDGSLWVWDAEAELPRHVLHHPESQRTWQVLAVPSTSKVLTSVVNGGSYLWDLADGGIVKRLTQNFASFDGAAFTPDGRLVLSMNRQVEPEVWSGADGRRLFSLRGHRAPVESIAIAGRGRHIVTGAGDGTLGWWRAADGERRQLLPLLQVGITALAVDSRGELLLTGDRNGAVTIRHAADGDEIVRLLSSWAGGWAVVSPDGRWDAPRDGRDPGLTVWSGRQYSLLADHPDRQVPGLLARVMKPHLEAGRSSRPASRDETSSLPPSEEAVAVPADPPAPSSTADADVSTAVARPRPPAPSLNALEPSTRGVVRPLQAGFLNDGPSINPYVDGHRVAFLYTSSDKRARLRIGDPGRPPGSRSLKNLEVPGWGRVGGWWRGFLYLISSDQLTIIDARDAENATVVGEMPVPSASSLDAADGHLYLAAECEGLRVLDLERPERPSLLPAGPSPDEFGCLKAVVARDRYVFATGRDASISPADSVFLVIDVTDPAAPSVIGRTLYFRDNRRDVTRFAVEGQHAYLAANDLGLVIFDLSNPAAPEEVARVDTPRLNDVVVAGDRAYLADFYLGLQILDVETPSDPRYLGGDDQAPEAGFGPSRLALSGDHLLVKSWHGVRILRFK